MISHKSGREAAQPKPLPPGEGDREAVERVSEVGHNFIEDIYIEGSE